MGSRGTTSTAGGSNSVAFERAIMENTTARDRRRAISDLLYNKPAGTRVDISDSYYLIKVNDAPGGTWRDSEGTTDFSEDWVKLLERTYRPTAQERRKRNNGSDSGIDTMKNHISQYFKSATGKPKIMRSRFAMIVVEDYESGKMKKSFRIPDIDSWVVQYNGRYDRGLAEEASNIIDIWEEVKSRRKW